MALIEKGRSRFTGSVGTTNTFEYSATTLAKEVDKAKTYSLDCKNSLDSQGQADPSKPTPLSNEDRCASRGGKWQ